MSEDIRKYKAIKEWFKEAEDMILTAVVGGEKYGRSIQFTIGDKYIVLSENQLLDLISVIARRLKCQEGFTATGYTEMKSVDEKGNLLEDMEEEIKCPFCRIPMKREIIGMIRMKTNG